MRTGLRNEELYAMRTGLRNEELCNEGWAT